ncbi:MAG TPA: hypothetical protein VHM65_07080, partial [Candidatus Lustribacter sp.]|nr:hypothetical protein [Candidatus Lustribacter sp.]
VVPSPRSGTAVTVFGSLTCVVAAAATLDDPLLRWLPIALAISTTASFAHQLLRGDHRPRLTESVAGSVSAVAIVASGVAMIPLGSLRHGAAVVLAVMLAVAGAVLVDLLARWESLRPFLVVTAMIVGALAGLGVALATTSLPELPLALVGAVAAATSAAARRVLVIPPAAASRAGAAAVAAAPVLVVGVLAYLVDLVFIT